MWGSNRVKCKIKIRPNTGDRIDRNRLDSNEINIKQINVCKLLLLGSRIHHVKIFAFDHKLIRLRLLNAANVGLPGSSCIHVAHVDRDSNIILGEGNLNRDDL